VAHASLVLSLSSELHRRTGRPDPASTPADPATVVHGEAKSDPGAGGSGGGGASLSLSLELGQRTGRPDLAVGAPRLTAWRLEAQI
jgi:hypothetical protein